MFKAEISLRRVNYDSLAQRAPSFSVRATSCCINSHTSTLRASINIMQA
jgi:hypothetical protein